MYPARARRSTSATAASSPSSCAACSRPERAAPVRRHRPACEREDLRRRGAREAAEGPVRLEGHLKEQLYESFGAGEELEEPIDEAALAILFSVARSQLAAGVSVAAESNFDADTDVAPFLQLVEEIELELIQIHIGGDTDALVEKFVRRAESGKRHPGHGDDAGDADELRAKLEAGHWEPLELPGVLVTADMHEDEEEIVTRVKAHVPASG